MVDNLTKEQRSYCMSKIRSSNTRAELSYKSQNNLLEFHPKGLFGNPDFADWKKKIVFFIDGCFWHMCPKHYAEPKSNKSYWNPKILKNIIRDAEISIAYKNAGWKVKRVWEHEIKP